MSRRLLLGLAVVVALLGAAVSELLMQGESAPRASGPLAQEAFVWQRVWTDGHAEAVRASRGRFGSLLVLAAEVDLKASTAEHVAYDASLLGREGQGVGLVIRVEPWPGPFGADDAVVAVALEAVARAEAAGLRVAELQIDFDCGERKLDGYRVWIEAIDAGLAAAGRDVAVTITALPAWLDRRACRRLVRATDGFVLQVHSLTAPKTWDDEAVLCDPSSARRWVERAAALGRPFRVALPTYSYMLEFEAPATGEAIEGEISGGEASGGGGGAYVGVLAEDAWPDDGGRYVYRLLEAEPGAMAGLIEAWTADRPMNLEGVVWFRLPVAGDRLNWPWPTLLAVSAGRVPVARLEAQAREPEGGLVEVDLFNAGDAAAAVGDVAVRLTWTGEGPIARDALAGYGWAAKKRLLPGEGLRWRRLLPGQRMTIAWMRFAQDTEVQAYVEMDPDD